MASGHAWAHHTTHHPVTVTIVVAWVRVARPSLRIQVPSLRVARHVAAVAVSAHDPEVVLAPRPSVLVVLGQRHHFVLGRTCVSREPQRMLMSVVMTHTQRRSPLGRRHRG